MNYILVVGSLNMDLTVKVKEMPKAGETIMCSGYALEAGGKGANQAYAAAKLGGIVSMIGAVGADDNGKKLVENLEKVAVNTSGILLQEDALTGQAVITVNNQGENSIIVIPGANDTLTKEWIDDNLPLIDQCNMVVLQLEIPIEVVLYVAKYAKERGKIVILDPAPVPEYFPQELYQYVDFIKPNQLELASLTGESTDSRAEIEKAAVVLLEKGAKNVIVTLGEHGAAWINKDIVKYYPAITVQAVDTTGAGDSFTAAFAVSLNQEMTNIDETINYCIKVASRVVTRKGAQSSIPSFDEI